MSGLYNFVSEFQTVPGMYVTLQEALPRILRRTVDCGLYLQEYFDVGFMGTSCASYLLHALNSYRSWLSSSFMVRDIEEIENVRG